MKCMPITSPGRRVVAPSSVSEIDEVLLARMTPSTNAVESLEELL
jgi:hypothetical protein